MPQAVRFDQYGGPDVLHVVDVEPPEPGDPPCGDVVARRRFARDVVEIAAQSSDQRQIRTQTPFVLREDGDVAQAGVRNADRPRERRWSQLY